jgi:hypothetical protein
MLVGARAWCVACTALPYHEDGLALVTSEGLEVRGHIRGRYGPERMPRRWEGLKD